MRLSTIQKQEIHCTLRVTNAAGSNTKTMSIKESKLNLINFEIGDNYTRYKYLLF